jgi:glycosyltransferase involved in cell wall biosynthesis
MFRVGKILPLVVVAPVPWFPFQSLIRRWRPHFRPPAPRREVQDGFEVLHPRFLSCPGVLKSLDGLFMALGSLPVMLALKRRFGFEIIDAHFAYPDGFAATLLGRWLTIPVTITLRGTEVPLSRARLRRWLMMKALHKARRIFAVADALKRHVVSLGVPADKISVVGNGVDVGRFCPVPRDQARHELGLPLNVPVLVSVGGLVERKGFHRVIGCLPALRVSLPGLRYLIAGGSSAEGDCREQLHKLVANLGLQDIVRFLGPVPRDRLRIPLSAADVFVLATRNEGWANVFLEAMACGLPVVTTDVGGNREVVSGPELGSMVPFGDEEALCSAIEDALRREWNREAIVRYARQNAWDHRVAVLVGEFTRLVSPCAAGPTEAGMAGIAAKQS